jgi:hypothetical protein
VAKLNAQNEMDSLKQLIESYEKLDSATQKETEAVFPEIAKAVESVEIRSLAGLKTSKKA